MAQRARCLEGGRLARLMLSARDRADRQLCNSTEKAHEQMRASRVLDELARSINSSTSTPHILNSPGIAGLGSGGKCASAWAVEQGNMAQQGRISVGGGVAH